MKETIEEICSYIEDNEKHMSLKVIGEEYNFDVDEIEKPHIIVLVPQVQLCRSLNSTYFEKSNIKTLKRSQRKSVSVLKKDSPHKWFDCVEVLYHTPISIEKVRQCIEFVRNPPMNHPIFYNRGRVPLIC